MLQNEKINIIKVGKLKELLGNFDDNTLLNFGTEELGFEINSYSSDGVILSLMSDDLEKVMKNAELFKYTNSTIDDKQGLKAKFKGTDEEYPNLIVNKAYDILYNQVDKYGIEWILLKNDDGRNVFYNVKFFEII